MSDYPNLRALAKKVAEGWISTHDAEHTFNAAEVAARALLAALDELNARRQWGKNYSRDWWVDHGDEIKAEVGDAERRLDALEAEAGE